MFVTYRSVPFFAIALFAAHVLPPWYQRFYHIGPCPEKFSELFLPYKPQDADYYKINGNNVIKEPGDQENQYACDQGRQRAECQVKVHTPSRLLSPVVIIALTRTAAPSGSHDILRSACPSFYSTGGIGVLRPKIRDMMNRIIKTKKSTFAIHTDVPAIPVNPKIPAIMATTRNTMAQ
jgi:hypothetical protein